jgi:hypothetical protein
MTEFNGDLEGAPDIGTLGGDFADADGETSATLGGDLTPEQGGANEEVNRDSGGYDFGAAELNAPGSSSLGQLFGYERSTGLPTKGGDFVGNSASYGFNDILNSPFGQIGRMLLGLNPVGAMFNSALSIAQNPAKGLLGLIPGLPGLGVRAAWGAINSPNPMGSLGQSLLGAGAGMLGGRLGGQLGGQLGARAGSQLAGRGASMLGGGLSASEQFARGAPPEGGDAQWTNTLQRNFGG